jgi:Domain of unknown function (DU1801)
MNVNSQIAHYITSQSDQKQKDLTTLHELILRLAPNSKLWFLDGKNSEGKIVSNPNIGYGNCTLSYANGSTKEFYCIGISANTSGISIYLFGIEDNDFLKNLIGKSIGKAKITGYCIKFKSLNDINIDALLLAVNSCFKMNHIK